MEGLEPSTTTFSGLPVYQLRHMDMTKSNDLTDDLNGYRLSPQGSRIVVHYYEPLFVYLWSSRRESNPSVIGFEGLVRLSGGSDIC